VTQFLELRFQIAFLYVVRFPCFDACHRLHHGETQASRKEIPLSPHKPVIGAFLDLPLGPGFAAVRDLIDKDSIEKSILQLRQTFYFAALKVITKSDWSRYIHFAFQQFANPLDYLKCVDQETEAEAEIRIFRYFCLHEEADAVVNFTTRA
jgi:hypothetical protein